MDPGGSAKRDAKSRRRLPSAPATPGSGASAAIAGARTRTSQRPREPAASPKTLARLSTTGTPTTSPAQTPLRSARAPRSRHTPRRPPAPAMQPLSPTSPASTGSNRIVSSTSIDQQSISSTSEDENKESQNVVVSVRVRPFSEREIDLRSELALTMSGNTATITNPEKGKTHTFNYDFCFWSHDPRAPDFADQSHVYQRIGVPLLNRCMEGYNCCLFAYGQTGSGKSYSMMGIPGAEVSRKGGSHGVIPRFTFELFDRIEELSQQGLSFKVEISYFEIYSERVYDLLAPPTKGRMQALKVREHPIMGPYVDNLKTYAVRSYNDIEEWLNVGAKHRATASTNMNATSSRSHAVFSMVVTQTENDEEGEEHSKVSKVNLVDLAGSERSDVAGTSGIRLREGSAINKSLHTLGKVISLLADKGASRRKKAFIPYRDSVLTWILKESLGGNSKTAMLATVSPARDNYEETLSTLRYAQQALKIVNVAQINEDPNLRLIRELRDEIDTLRAQFGTPSNSSQEVATLRGKLAQTQALMNAMNRSWEEKLRIAERTRQQYEKQKETQAPSQQLQHIGNQQPTLVNLNEDPQLSEMLVYSLKQGKVIVGNSEDADVKLGGALVLPRHCVIACKPHGDTHAVTLTPEPDALVFVNGHEVEPETIVAVQHADRIIFGNHHFFRLNVPSKSAATKLQLAKDKEAQEKNYQFAKKEVEAVQAKRLQDQLERERKRVQTELAAEHEQQRSEYQKALETKLEQQKREYEDKLKALQSAIQETDSEKEALLKKAEAEALQVQREERQLAQERLQEQKRQLEEEKKELEQRLQEESSKEKQKLEEMNKIIEELRQEKDTIQSAMEELKTSKDRGEGSSLNLKTIVSPTDAEDVFDETVDPRTILATTQTFTEANKIAKDLGQNTMFTLCNSRGQPMVKVTNTNMKVSTLWSLDKYEDRLRQMRDLYTEWETTRTAPEGVRQLYFDDIDEWQPDVQAEASPSLSEHMQAADFLASQHSPVKSRSASGSDDNSVFTPRSSRTNGVRLRPKTAGQQLAAAYSAEPSVVAICRRYVHNISAALNAFDAQFMLTNELVSCLSSLKVAVGVLRDGYETHNAQDGDTLLSLKDTGVARNASISATTAMHGIGAVVRNLRSQAETGPVLELAQQLGAKAESCANNVIKLFHGVENEIPLMVSAGHEDALTDITSLSTIAGELAIVLDPKADQSKSDHGDEEEDEDEEEDGYEEHDENETKTFMPTRLVDLPSGGRQRSSSYLDDALTTATARATVDEGILAAFHTGTRLFVEKSFAACKQDVSTLRGKLEALKTSLRESSDLTPDIVDLVKDVVEKAVAVVANTEELQAILTAETRENGGVAISRTFYNKSFARARGLVRQVQDMTDAVVWLCDSCDLAAAGQEDLPQVMTRGQNLRTSAAHLQTAAEFKVGRLGRGQTLLSTLKGSISKMYSATAAFTKLCQERLAQQTKERSSAPVVSIPDRGNAVAQKKQIMEEQAAIMRLESELQQRRSTLSSLRRSSYNSQTSAI